MPDKIYKRRPKTFVELDKPVNRKYTGPSASKIRENLENKHTQRSLASRES